MRRPILGQERPDHVPLRLDELRLVLAQHRQRLRAAELVGDLAPRRPAQRRAIVAPAAAQRVELGADEDRGGRLGDALQPGLAQEPSHPLPLARGRPVPAQVIEQRERVRLAAAELGAQVEDRRRLGALARQPAQHLAGQVGQVAGQVGAAEEAGRVLVVAGRAAVAHLVQVDGELGRVQGAVFPQVFAGVDDLVPGFEGHFEAFQSTEAVKQLTGCDAVTLHLQLEALSCPAAPQNRELPQPSAVPFAGAQLLDILQPTGVCQR